MTVVRPASGSVGDLVGRATSGPVALGTVPAVTGRRNHLVDAVAAARDAGILLTPGLPALIAAWSTRLALTRITPPPAVHRALVVDVSGPLLLADRSGPDGHHVEALPPEGLPALLTDHLSEDLVEHRSASSNPAAPWLVERALDPAAVVVGEVAADVRAQLARTVVTLEAAYARRDEVHRTHRPVVSLFGDGSSYLCLVARPRTATLRMHHLDAGGTARLLADILLEVDEETTRHRLAPAARRRHVEP